MGYTADANVFEIYFGFTMEAYSYILVHRKGEVCIILI